MGKNSWRVVVPKGTVKKEMDAEVNAKGMNVAVAKGTVKKWKEAKIIVKDEPKVTVKDEPMSESEAADKGTTQCTNPQHKRGCEMADDSCSLRFFGQFAKLMQVIHSSKRGCTREQLERMHRWSSP